MPQAPAAPPRTASRSRVAQCAACPWCWTCCQRFDSGTQLLIMKLSKAGVAATIINSRQPPWATRTVAHASGQWTAASHEGASCRTLARPRPRSAVSKKPTLAAVPIRPASKPATVVRPDFHDERHAQRPFAAHAECRQEPQTGERPRRAGQPAQPAEDRVRQHAERHRPHPADAVAEPAEQHAAGGRPHEEAGGRDVEPAVDELADRSWPAGRPERAAPTSGNRPISKPSNIQPSRAAESAIQRPLVESDSAWEPIAARPVCGNGVQAKNP